MTATVAVSDRSTLATRNSAVIAQISSTRRSLSRHVVGLCN
jgi:hypothetical protein